MVVLSSSSDMISFKCVGSALSGGGVGMEALGAFCGRSICALRLRLAALDLAIVWEVDQIKLQLPPSEVGGISLCNPPFATVDQLATKCTEQDRFDNSIFHGLTLLAMHTIHGK